MRKFLVILTVLFAAVDVMAQEHLSFKGIPIEGSMKKFCKKLEAEGFVSIGREGNITTFSGNFTGRDVNVGVVTTDNGKNVLGVVVLFDPSREWNDLVDTYNYYKELYTRKYGRPTASKEYNPARMDSNIALMEEVHNGTAEYISVWDVPGGDITLKIQKTSGFKGAVGIVYRDAQNLEAKIQENLGDI